MRDDEVPALVKRLRARLGLTQEQFAQRVGVTYSTVNHWENGKRVPQPFLVRRLLQLGEGLEPGSGEPAKNVVPSAARDPGSAAEREPEAGLPAQVAEMVHRIVEEFSPEKVILFGSYARGQARPDSDVDLLVVMPVHGSKRAAQLSVRKALRDIPFPKDVVVTTPEEFEWRQGVAGTIERPAAREGRLMYARE